MGASGTGRQPPQRPRGHQNLRSLLTRKRGLWEMEGASRAQRASGQVCAWKGAQGSVCRQTQRKEAPSQGRRQRGHQPSAGS